VLAVKRDAATLTSADVETARDAIAAAGHEPGPVHWLARDEAASFEIEGGMQPAAARDAVREALSTRPIDVVARPRLTGSVGLFISDMDSTIVGCECIDEIADFCGRGDEVAEITAAAMRGEIDFAESLRRRVAMLEGLEADMLRQVYDERVRLNPGARELLATLGAQHTCTILVSGGFTYFAERIARKAGFEGFHANELEIRNGRLTGRLVGEILDATGKFRVLLRAAAALKLDLERCIALGDGANDLPMMQAAGISIGYRAKPKLAEIASGNLTHAGLDAVLFALGIPRSRFRGVRNGG